MTMRGAQWLEQATLRLIDCDTPAVDAEILLAFALDMPRHEIRNAVVSDQVLARLDPLLLRRVSGEPLQYITGEAPFRHLILHVGPGVLVPRPETELLVDHALNEIRGGAERVIDLGAGAGPIAIALATESAAEVIAVEREADALIWLRQNVAEFAPRVGIVASDVADVNVDPLVDLVVANPPYLPEGTPLPRDVLEHEPASALWGGPDGTAVPAIFVQAAHRLLRPGGLLLMEHSDQHQHAVMALLAGWQSVQGHRDLLGRPRFVSARRAE